MGTGASSSGRPTRSSRSSRGRRPAPSASCTPALCRGRSTSTRSSRACRRARAARAPPPAASSRARAGVPSSKCSRLWGNGLSSPSGACCPCLPRSRSVPGALPGGSRDCLPLGSRRRSCSLVPRRWLRMSSGIRVASAPPRVLGPLRNLGRCTAHLSRYTSDLATWRS